MPGQPVRRGVVRKVQGRVQGRTPSQAAPAVGTVVPVTRRPDTIRLQLELTSLDDPIEGHIADRHGTSIPFTGWLELMAAVQRLTHKPPGPAHERPPATPNHRDAGPSVVTTASRDRHVHPKETAAPAATRPPAATYPRHGYESPTAATRDGAPRRGSATTTV